MMAWWFRKRASFVVVGLPIYSDTLKRPAAARFAGAIFIAFGLALAAATASDEVTPYFVVLRMEFNMSLKDITTQYQNLRRWGVPCTNYSMRRLLGAEHSIHPLTFLRTAYRKCGMHTAVGCRET
jgi:hypothetical protein